MLIPRPDRWTSHLSSSSTILGEGEAGRKVADILRDHGIIQDMYYRWKRKFSGMSVTDAKRLKQLEEENRRLKRMVANLTLDGGAQRRPEPKVVKPAARRGGAALARGPGSEPASSLRASRDASIDVLVSDARWGRRGTAATLARARGGASSLWIPPGSLLLVPEGSG